MDKIELKQSILESLLEIPKGKVTTYKNLGLRFGTHPRMVSQTMRYNKYPDKYPCYKVIANDGSISGYSGVNGVEGKIKRLENDGIDIIKGKINIKFII